MKLKRNLKAKMTRHKDINCDFFLKRHVFQLYTGKCLIKVILFLEFVIILVIQKLQIKQPTTSE